MYEGSAHSAGSHGAVVCIVIHAGRLGDLYILQVVCIAFGELSREIVLAIAEYEHVPEISAVAIGDKLMRCSEGLQQIHMMVLAVIEAALERGDQNHASSLKQTLDAFVADFPTAADR